jgi:hypothetical protein
MRGNSSKSSGGIGFMGLLTIVFITLKLIGKIDWSWWWVLSPIWITCSITALIVLTVFFIPRQIKKRRRNKFQHVE